MMELAPKSLPRPDFMLSKEAYTQIADALRELERATRADLAVFCEANGVAVTHAGRLERMHLANFSTLAAANFAATSEMARIVGEQDGFRFLFLEGEERNIYLCNVGYEFLLVITFSKNVALGMVRIYANRAVKKLREILDHVRQTEERLASEILDEDFGALLDKALDASFKV